ncbi:hypothetical protein [Yinghuangia sp. YIM S09857]|uniref:hypothetical protein n=1 Tax=Yinghuangia sp. YIM S09857 TaxID=3436929 RepID=UPI003F536A81
MTAAIPGDASPAPEGSRWWRRCARGVIVLGAALLVLGLLPGAPAPEARADEPKIGADCTLVPEDIWGYEYSKYCGSEDPKMLLMENPPKGYVNGNLGKCQGMPDMNLMEEKKKDDSFLGKVGRLWEGAKDVGNLIWEEMKPGSEGKRGTKLLCVRGEMLQWQKGHEQGNLFVLSPKLELVNPCNTLNKEMRAKCADPRGKNPCDDVVSMVGRGHCESSHPDFKRESEIGPCAGLIEQHYERCWKKEEEKKKKKELAEKEHLVAPLEDILGWVFIFVGVSGWVGVILTAKGMAMAWYTGEGLAHFNRGGYVVIAVIMGSSASAIAGFFYI